MGLTESGQLFAEMAVWLESDLWTLLWCFCLAVRTEQLLPTSGFSTEPLKVIHF